MTTAAQRDAMRAQLDAARHRSERAADLGDHAGALIAAGDARRLYRALAAAVAVSAPHGYQITGRTADR
jgi:hypothetical protein